MRSAAPAAKTGFSLLELLVVVALVSILAALGAASLGHFSSESGLKRAVAEAAGVFESARQHALTYNTHAYVAFAELGEGNDRKLVLASFVSPDGLRAVDMSQAGTAVADGSVLAQLARPRAFPNARLGKAPGTDQADIRNSLPRIRSRAGGTEIEFSNIVHFLPSGEAALSNAKVAEIGFSLTSAGGGQAGAEARGYGFTLSGITGQVRVKPL